MGQQQLLLLVLAAIIVGISVVVGMNMFSESSDQANIDAIRQDLITVSSQAQAWYKRPSMMGGGGNQFTGLDFTKMSFPSDSTTNSDKTAHNVNGSYELTSVQSDSVTIVATPAIAENIELTAEVGKGGVKITSGTP